MRTTSPKNELAACEVISEVTKTLTAEDGTLEVQVVFGVQRPGQTTLQSLPKETYDRDLEGLSQYRAFIVYHHPSAGRQVVRVPSGSVRKNVEDAIANLTNDSMWELINE